MANVSVLNMEGKEVGSMELNDAVFGVEINEHLVHQAVVLQLANNRQGTQKAKIRALSGDGNSPAAPDENLYPYFLFKLPDRACKRRLRDKKLLRRLVHRALLRYCQRVLHLLQCHSVSPVNVFMLRL